MVTFKYFSLMDFWPPHCDFNCDQTRTNCRSDNFHTSTEILIGTCNFCNYLEIEHVKNSPPNARIPNKYLTKTCTRNLYRLAHSDRKLYTKMNLVDRKRTTKFGCDNKIRKIDWEFLQFAFPRTRLATAQRRLAGITAARAGDAAPRTITFGFTTIVWNRD